ncbi:MAG: ribose 5-phosphate isomerase B [Polyangiales bacterium]|nr:ribose 5-phosphate isomerase B [Sandaracinaceae bacterium]
MSQKPTLVFGSDHAGLTLKVALKARAEELGYVVEDVGTHDGTSTDYPDWAHRVAGRVAKGEGLGVLVCGTGIGMSIAANRHPGVRAALCGDVFSARATRAHNDANILCLGERVVGVGLALLILEAFLETPFEGGRHQRRIDKMEPGAAEG